MSNDARGGNQVIYPWLRYRDAPAAIDWLERAFGFERREVYPDESGGILHARLVLGPGMVTLSSIHGNPPGRSPRDMNLDGGVYAYVDGVDAHHERASAAGAEILYPPVDQPYGHRDYSCRDLEGNLWSFGDYHP